jgi:predicted transcriptional regulator
MGKGAVSSEKSSGENIQHFSHFRMRAVGISNLRAVVHSMDYIKQKELTPVPTHVLSRIQPVRLVNVVEQRASFEFAHLVMDEYVKINRIVIYMKEIYTSTPGR